VDVYNSSQTSGLAGDLSKALVKKGYRAGAVQQYQPAIPLTTITYGAGAAAKSNAQAIARYFGLTATASSTLAAGHVQVILGGSTQFLPAAFTSKPASTPSTTPASTSTANTGNSDVNAAKSSLAKEAKAKYGIPCVY
jgi:hypothetical protein